MTVDVIKSGRHSTLHPNFGCDRFNGVRFILVTVLTTPAKPQ